MMRRPLCYRFLLHIFLVTLLPPYLIILHKKLLVEGKKRIETIIQKVVEFFLWIAWCMKWKLYWIRTFLTYLIRTVLPLLLLNHLHTHLSGTLAFLATYLHFDLIVKIQIFINFPPFTYIHNGSENMKCSMLAVVQATEEKIKNSSQKKVYTFMWNHKFLWNAPPSTSRCLTHSNIIPL